MNINCLKYDLSYFYPNDILIHPQKDMEALGITYEYASPQMMFDCWFFFNCKNVPDPLPPHLSIKHLDPNDWVFPASIAKQIILNRT
jgi:hypothetical protein